MNADLPGGIRDTENMISTVLRDPGLGLILRECADGHRLDILRAVSTYLQTRAAAPFGISTARIAAVQRTVDEQLARENALAGYRPDGMWISVFLHDATRTGRADYTVKLVSGSIPNLPQSTTGPDGWATLPLDGPGWSRVLGTEPITLQAFDPTGRPVPLGENTFTFAAGSVRVMDFAV